MATAASLIGGKGCGEEMGKRVVEGMGKGEGRRWEEGESNKEGDGKG